ncbi:MAG: ParB/RepB/Spo0J family partition protein [Planctomycetaceae bacterium]|jgi:hypothetical protein|nr:ParB/RepB/Spo0J family partition protein [Planctomycetaceae bacterium]
MKELTIIDELKNLLPPLTEAEFTGLEESILKDGCLSPLVVWNNILVDGHHRYEICCKHQIPYAIKNVELDNLDHAKFWVWQHQENRRNMTPYHRGELALKFKEVISAKAKKRQCCGQGGILLGVILPQANKTRQELAEKAEVSERTLDKIEYISSHADEETKSKLRRGDTGTSINKEYQRLKSYVESKKPIKSLRQSQSSMAKPVTIKSRSHLKDTYCCGVEFEPDPGDTYYDWLTDKERSEFLELQKNCVNPIFSQIRNITIQNIPEHKPDNLINCLFGLFSPLYRQKLAYGLLRRMFQTAEDKDNAVTVVKDFYHEFQ